MKKSTAIFNKSLLVSVLMMFATLGHAQGTNDMDKVRSINSTIKTLYSVISGEKGEERNWQLFNFLFHPDAKLIPLVKQEDSLYQARYFTATEYLSSSGKWLVENGFYEKEIHRSANTFGNIAQVFSTYESFHSEADEAPFMRGINSIQLMDDGQRWWIINICWMQESKENPIPKEYLPQY
jgi:hypothetical protein